MFALRHLRQTLSRRSRALGQLASAPSSGLFGPADRRTTVYGDPLAQDEKDPSPEGRCRRDPMWRYVALLSIGLPTLAGGGDGWPYSPCIIVMLGGYTHVCTHTNAYTYMYCRKLYSIEKYINIESMKDRRGRRMTPYQEALAMDPQR